MSDYENKSKTLPINEVKLQGDEQKYTFTGYGAVFGNTDSYNDIIVKGAFDSYLFGLENGEYKMPKLLYGHDLKSMPIGKILKLEQDDYGLKMTAELTKGMSTAEDVRASIKHGTIEGLSIGYQTKDFEIDQMTGTRYLKDLLLGEISVVSIPANDKSKIDVTSIKSAAEEVKSVKDLEKFFKDKLNCSNEAAKTVISMTRTLLLQEQAEETKAQKAKEDEEQALTAIVQAYIKMNSK